MKYTILFLIVLMASVAHSKEYDDIRNVQYVKNYDGDTVTFNIPEYPDIIGNNISIRVDGIDTPEIRGKCENEKVLAKELKALVGCILSNAKTINLIAPQRGKYFRIVADIQYDNISLTDTLLALPYVYEYDGGTKTNHWCD